MAYWWVNQNKTHHLENADGYLWAPIRDKAGRSNKHWELMEHVEPGDLIFSYVSAEIRKIAIAQTTATPASRPVGRSFDPWKRDGRRVEAEYIDLSKPLSNLVLQRELGSDLMGSGVDRPLTSTGRGKQAYFFSLQPIVGRKLLELSAIEGNIPTEDLSVVISRAAPIGTPTETTRKAVRESRIGQGRFRQDVLKAWNGRCSVTGTNIQEAIRASHIKPWADSNNRERIDANNGLPLVATLDSLFDKGLITFESDGQMTIFVDRDQWSALGLRADLRLRHVPTNEMRNYLDHHRKHVVSR